MGIFSRYFQRKEGSSLENISDLWQQALAKIEKKISKPSFETWMKSTKAHNLQGDTLVIKHLMNLLEIG